MPTVLRAEAERNLSALRGEQERAWRALQGQLSAILASPCTPRSARQINLVYKLLQYQHLDCTLVVYDGQIRTHVEEFFAVLDLKLCAMDLIQKELGEIDEDQNLRALMITTTDCRLVEETIRIIERGVRVMHYLSGKHEQSRHSAGAPLPSPAESNASPPEHAVIGDAHEADSAKNGDDAKNVRESATPSNWRRFGGVPSFDPPVTGTGAVRSDGAMATTIDGARRRSGGGMERAAGAEEAMKRCRHGGARAERSVMADAAEGASDRVRARERRGDQDVEHAVAASAGVRRLASAAAATANVKRARLDVGGEGTAENVQQ